MRAQTEKRRSCGFTFFFEIVVLLLVVEIILRFYFKKKDYPAVLLTATNR